MEVNDTVYYWKQDLLEESTIFMLGGNMQVLLDEGGEWVLKYINEVIHIKNMTDKEWKYVNV